MSTNNYSMIMRGLRVYMRNLKQIDKNRNNKVQTLDRLKGSKAYDDEIAELDRETAQKKDALLLSTKKELISILDRMRESVTANVQKEPTAGQVATLSLLDSFSQLSPTDINTYAASMSNNPLCMRRLQEIARKHNLQFVTPTQDDLLATIQRLDGACGYFLDNYGGEVSNSQPGAWAMAQYLNADETDAAQTVYGSVDAVDAKFWDEYVGRYAYNATPDYLDNWASAAPQAQYYFKDVQSLAEYIQTQKAGKDSYEAERTERTILENCPDSYGSAYRCYRSSGEIVPLNET